MANKKNVIILGIIVTISIIVIYWIIGKNEEKEFLSKENSYEGMQYEYDNKTEYYTVYDENNNELGKVKNKEEIKKYSDNPDYDISKRPEGFSEENIPNELDDNMENDSINFYEDL